MSQRKGKLERLATSTMQINTDPHRLLKKQQAELENVKAEIERLQSKLGQKKEKQVVVTSTGRKISISYEGGEKEEKGGARVIHTGPRGGRYMMVHGKKVYLPK